MIKHSQEDLDLADQARSSIGEYCYTECNAYCCRKGYIILNPAEADLLTSNMKDDSKSLRKGNDGRYLINLQTGGGCPSLKDNKCTVHKNPIRPSPCKEFPLFIADDKTIKIAERCPAAKKGMMYTQLAEFKKRGFTLVYENEPF